MNDKMKKQKISSICLKLFILCSLLFPAMYSPYTDVYQSAYYGGFSWANFFLVLGLGIQLWEFFREGKRFAGGWIWYLALLLLYNLLSLYFNHKYLHWYWEQINNTVAFLAFFVLVCTKAKLDNGKDDNIRFLIRCIVLSNIASLAYYFMGYTKLLICNHRFVFYELPENFYEARHYWIYSHKSEYALMLVAFTALFVAYRRKFHSRLTYFLSLAVLFACLYLTHSWTGMGAAVLIFLGGLLDEINWKTFHWKRRYLAGGAVVVLAAAGAASRILAERNLFSLGGRPQIWVAVMETVRKHPEGWGMRFGESMMAVTENWMVNNGHNVFLNQILRFSVPVGICFTVLFLGIAVWSLWRSRTWLSAGMWLALLVLLNMDYSLMSLQMALLFLIVYLVCIYPVEREAVHKTTER